MHASLALTLLSLPALVALAPAPPQESAAAAVVAPAPELLARPVVLGASMSSGFGVAGDVGFADVLARTLRVDGDVAAKASEYFFLGPLEMGDEQGEYAQDAEATIVFAVDYLFWFGYGTMNAEGGVLTSEEERLELLEVGLDNLSQLDCPLVVGDFPDMSDSVGKMLLEAQMPAEETLAKLTARVHEWAAEREHTVVVPLARLVASLKSDDVFEAGSFRFPAHSKRRLLQADDLHPTLTGLCLLGHVVADALVDAGVLTADAVELDLTAVLASFELPTAGVERVTAAAPGGDE